MSYPVSIDTKNLFEFLADRDEIAWAVTNQDAILIAKGGNESLFGLDRVKKGQNLLDHYVCLEGLIPLSGIPYEIYELELASDKIINVYCLPSKEGDRIIFHDVSTIAMVKNQVHTKIQEIMGFIENYNKNTH